MKESINILYGAINSHVSEHGRAKQIYPRLMKKSDITITWIDPPFIIPNIMDYINVLINQYQKNKIEIFNGIRGYVSIGMPFSDKSKILTHITEKMLAGYLKKLNIDFNILVISNPIFLDYVKQVKKRRIPIVYDCRDLFSGWRHNGKFEIKREKELLSLCDQIIVPSTSLKKEILGINSMCSVTVIPNGVPKSMITNKIRNSSSRPKIGYVGHMGYYVNLDLIIEIAKEKTTWDFIFVGDTTPIEKIVEVAPKNCRFLGEVSFTKLNSILKMFDVGIIPFKQLKVTDVVLPIKLFEYFAKGIPIVSTPLKELKNLKENHLIHFANSKQEWINQIENALKDKRHDEFTEFAKKYTWENITEDYVRCFKKLMTNSFDDKKID